MFWSGYWNCWTLLMGIQNSNRSAIRQSGKFSKSYASSYCMRNVTPGPTQENFYANHSSIIHNRQKGRNYPTTINSRKETQNKIKLYKGIAFDHKRNERLLYIQQHGWSTEYMKLNARGLSHRTTYCVTPYCAMCSAHRKRKFFSGCQRKGIGMMLTVIGFSLGVTKISLQSTVVIDTNSGLYEKLQVNHCEWANCISTKLRKTEAMTSCAM